MQQPISIPLRGGLDLVTPAMQKRPGVMIGGVNYEADASGYRRIAGYERFDGRLKPSDASYWSLAAQNATGTADAGDTLTGGTSGATGTVLVDWAGTGDIILGEVVGTFVDGEDLEVSAAKIAEADGTAQENGEPVPANDLTYTLAAAALRRADITAVPGSGPVRGVVVYKGDTYAIRDNAGATAGVLHKATTSGWSAQSLGNYLAFDAGTVAFTEGTTLTGGTSGATATIRRVVVESGSTGSSNQTGRLYLGPVTGTFQNNEAITSSPGAAVANGTLTALTLPAGGRYEFIVHNFYGNVASERLYGASGVGPAFEWDGTTFAEVRTGLPSNLEKPTFIAEFRFALWLGYVQGSWQYSALGNPLGWNAALDGNGEIAIGDVPTGAASTASALVLFSKSRRDYITGTGDATNDPFRPVVIGTDAGAVAYTPVLADTPYYMETGAIRKITQADTLGGWRTGSVSELVEPLWQLWKRNGVTPVGSLRIRGRDIMRFFMSDKTGVSVYIGRKQPEITTFEYPFQAYCVYSSDADETETILVGAEDGFVYELERGSTFDGADVVAWCRLAYIHGGSPMTNKAWHHATVEAETPTFATLEVAHEVDYGNPDNVPATSLATILAGGGFWDEAVWNEFVWDAQTVGEIYFDILNLGRNVTISFRNETKQFSHVLQMLTLYAMPRGLVRR